MTLKVKYADFQQVRAAAPFPPACGDPAALEGTVLDLLAPLLPVRLGVRLLGVTLSGLEAEDVSAVRQMTLAF